RKIGFAANRRLLDVQRIGHDCFIGEASFQDMQRPVTVDGQRAAALRFADPRVQGLLHVLLLFVLVQGTFAHSDLREHLAPLLGQKPSQLTPGQITYDLRRLRLHGLIERIPKSYRYRITARGLRTAIFYTRLYDRALRTGLQSLSLLEIGFWLATSGTFVGLVAFQGYRLTRLQKCARTPLEAAEVGSGISTVLARSASRALT